MGCHQWHSLLSKPHPVSTSEACSLLALQWPLQLSPTTASAEPKLGHPPPMLSHPWGKSRAHGKPKPGQAPAPGFPGSSGRGGWEERPNREGSWEAERGTGRGRVWVGSDPAYLLLFHRCQSPPGQAHTQGRGLVQSLRWGEQELLCVSWSEGG